MKAKEDDQVERFAGEVKDGTWLKNAQQRSQRRKSAWNLLLPLLGFPLWLTFAFFFFDSAGSLMQASIRQRMLLLASSSVGLFGWQQP